MKRVHWLVGCILIAGGLHAQDLPLPARNPRVGPSAPVVVQVAPQVTSSAAIDEHAANQKLSARIAELRRENAALNATVVSLKANLAAFTSKGGSAVHAYCEDTPSAGSGLSVTTAGAREDCAGSGYLCQPVSGLCRTTCQTTAMCAPGWVCDTDAQHCIVVGR
jgi:hypothetical protein